MISFTLTPGAGFNPGDTVYVFRQVKPGLPVGAPTNDPVASATAAADGSVVFEGLQINTPYLAYADHDGQHKWVAFSTNSTLGGDGSLDVFQSTITSIQSNLASLVNTVSLLAGSVVGFSTDPNARPDAAVVIFITAEEPQVAENNDIWIAPEEE